MHERRRVDGRRRTERCYEPPTPHHPPPLLESMAPTTRRYMGLRRFVARCLPSIIRRSGRTGRRLATRCADSTSAARRGVPDRPNSRSGARRKEWQPAAVVDGAASLAWCVACAMHAARRRAAPLPQSGPSRSVRVFRVTLGVDAKDLLGCLSECFQSAFRVKCKRPDVFSYYPPQLRLQPTLASVSQR